MSLNVLSPFTVGPYTLANRVVFAPCTRCRADADHAPTAINALYYRQRASVGLIITEASQISPRGIGYPATPGIHTEKQIEGWKLVTKAVHEAGGRIFCQLWHVGRVSHQSYQPNGELPVSSWPAPRQTEIMLADGSKAPAPTPHMLTIDEIRATMADYRHAAECALKAGFDGVELHGANGYLPDQFLRDGVNKRTDEYGGSIENRAKFHIEATKALCEVFGAARVGVRLSPSGVFNDMFDSNPRATFGYVATQLSALGLGYLHIMEAMESDLRHGPRSFSGYEAIPVSYFRPMVKCTLITNAGFTHEKANAYISEGWADAIAFGTAVIANPDLPERFRTNAPLNKPDMATFYGGGEKGYTDYPFLPVTR
jgi:N-ethylmaleimide reductase